MFPLDEIEVGVAEAKVAFPPESARLKSDASKLPLPPVVLKTGSLNVTAIVLLFAAIVDVLILGSVLVAI